MADIDAGRTVPTDEAFAEIRREMQRRREAKDAAE
jgi:predicted transcriptional regulator